MIREKQEFHGTFPSVLTEDCGFPVTFTVSGTLTNLKFPDRAVGPKEIRISNAVMIFKAGDKTVRFQNVGAEVDLVEPDGTTITLKAGHHPPVLDEVTGVQKVNTETGDIIFQSHKVSDPQRICQQLRPG